MTLTTPETTLRERKRRIMPKARTQIQQLQSAGCEQEYQTNGGLLLSQRAAVANQGPAPGYINQDEHQSYVPDHIEQASKNPSVG